jgi:hypothetical protein
MTETSRPHSTETELGAIPRWWARLLDGRHEWGAIDTSPTRHGVTRYRLVVFPPGTDAVERRLLRAWRAWPTWGLMVWVVAQFLVGTILTPGTAFVASTIAYLAVGAVLFARVAELRTRVRTLSVVQMAGYPDPHSAAVFKELKSLAAALCHADYLRDSGQSSPADHEAAWWRVYDRLDQNLAGPVAC